VHTHGIIITISPSHKLSPHTQSLELIKDSKGIIIDQTMIVFHPGPNSYTGEDLAEISCHGNPLVVKRIMEAISSTGLARLAHKGEFTRRAFLNHKMDLVQAEAVGALIDSSSPAGCDMAHALLKGELSGQIKSMIEIIMGILTDIEASFITEDESIRQDVLLERLTEITSQISGLLKDATEAKGIYEGIVTTIAGLPNVGKSSLFNAILGYDRAIVHHEEGTTRDVLREHLNLGGIDFVFHDTAGIRETTSGPEQIGVEKTIETLKASNLVLYVVDARQGIKPHERQWLALADKTIVVMNKKDLVEGEVHDALGYDTVGISAKFTLGIDELLTAMRQAFPHDQPLVFLDRHAYLLGKALNSLNSCLKAALEGFTSDVLTIDLKHTMDHLRQMTGETADEDILERIFSSFCIGK
jgi:tRNA modification GTPase